MISASTSDWPVGAGAGPRPPVTAADSSAALCLVREREAKRPTKNIIVRSTQSARMPESPLSSLLLEIEERNDVTLLDSARTLLDSLDLEGTVSTIVKLLDWRSVPASAAAARRERCRLVSYAAIMHGAALLPNLSRIVRLIMPLLGDPDALVAEELLRTVGNLARYVLEANSGERQPDALSAFFAPLIGGALSSRLCFLALHRGLLCLPHNLQRAADERREEGR